MNPATTGLLIIDLTNDFLSPGGAYHRGGQAVPEMAALPARIGPVAAKLRDRGGWVISAEFTLVPGKDGEPFISPHLKKMRPFLGKGDFAPGSHGQALVDALQPADLRVEKIAYSAFYMSRLEWALRKAGIRTLVVCGITTNGGVASTVRAAHVRDFETLVLTDGCAAFSPQSHAAALADMASVARLIRCEEAIGLIG